MTPEQIDRVFGRGRLKMATGDHVEVFREAAARGERRRYTKRFLNTQEADFAHWTEREWKILARLIGHGIGCVPDVVQFDRGAAGGTQIVQTYDAGATVDQWATILPVSRKGRTYRHVFEDCAHWWALAHHCLIALRAIHELSLVHLDIKGDNICIPVGPAGFDPSAPNARMYPVFDQIALIDFAFSLVSREPLAVPLPIGWQTTYDYQSPRLLHALESGRNGDLTPTRSLDWRCDMYSLAAMLKRYLPGDDVVHGAGDAAGWTADRYHAAKALLLALRDAHDRDSAAVRPHDELLRATSAELATADFMASLEDGWTLARDADVANVEALPMTPLTRLAPSLYKTAFNTQPGPQMASVSDPLRTEATIARIPALRLETHATWDSGEQDAQRIGASRGEVLTSLPPIFVSPRTTTSFPHAVRRRSGAIGAGGAASDARSFTRAEPATAASSAVEKAAPRSTRQGVWVTGALSSLIAGSFVFAVLPQIHHAFPQTMASADSLKDAFRAVFAQRGSGPTTERAAGASASSGIEGASAATTAAGATEDVPPGVQPKASPQATTTSSDVAQGASDVARMPPPAAERASEPAPAKAPAPTSIGALSPPNALASPSTVPTLQSSPRVATVASDTARAGSVRGNDKHAASQRVAKVGAAVDRNAARKEASAALASSPSSPAHATSEGRKAGRPQATTAVVASKASPMIASVAQHPATASSSPSVATTASIAATTASAPTAATASLKGEPSVGDASPMVSSQRDRTAESAIAETPTTAPRSDARALNSESASAPPSTMQPGRRVDTARMESRHEGWLSSLLNLAKRGGRAAPIEERTADTRIASTSGARKRVAATTSLPMTPHDERPSTPSNVDVTTNALVATPAPVASSPVLRSANAASPAGGLPSAADTSSRTIASTSNADPRTSALPASPSVPVPPAPTMSPGFENAAAPANGASAALAPEAVDRYEAASGASGAAEIGRRMISDYVSRTAMQAEPEIARVLERAGALYGADQQALIVDAARRSWGRNAIAVPVALTSPMARASTSPLKDAARRAFWAQRNFDEAIDLHLRAFGADPYDAELAGNLASLYLRAHPAQPHTARQLAMHAMALSSAQARSPRVQDWGTFAVASALSGRNDDATHALFVTAALASNLGTTCKTALGAVATYGERMRVPVESMLLRIQQQGRDRESPYCSFPPRWNYAGRFY